MKPAFLAPLSLAGSRSLTGAWIETQPLPLVPLPLPVAPLRGRGLKPEQTVADGDVYRVAPLRGRGLKPHEPRRGDVDSASLPYGGVD